MNCVMIAIHMCLTRAPGTAMRTFATNEVNTVIVDPHDMTNPEEPLQLRLCGVAAESARASAIYASVAQLVSAANLALKLLSL